ncbi:hypothetical protein WR25_07188 [Diploscapter pachys]|uniref:Uncharacterized protein n=1 Tax=Diploscapter pachys TaxID=2018661 RepID=A0A2A2LMT1_9BILA|nr:hypothetical protein WR25_07188 [Diploscapter pachys]
MSPIQQDATDLFEEKSTARVEKEIPIQFVYEEDESSKSSLHPPLFSVRHGSARKSIRSQSEDQMLNMSIKSLFVAFCHRTSSHGIPFMGMSTFFGKTIWICAFSCALLSFLIQTYWTFSAYFQYRTIIEMQLKFKAAPFPAATVCNLNPFKYSELVMFEEIREGFEIWEQVINAREMNDRIKYGESGNLFGAGEEDTLDLRRKREMEVMENAENEGADYQPVFVRCTCLNAEQCVPNRNPLEVNASVCMCFEDVTKGNIWPCYPTSAWTVKSEIKWWNPQNWNISRVTEPPPIVTYDENEAYGLRDKYDAGSITVQTKENLIFMVAALPREIKRNLSYSLKEFVKRCSFNAKDCNMTEDFKLHLDPEYGNCYTFNFNDSVTKTNSRAGPVYGLRLLLDVHQDDYMPTTEAAGVRLVIHEQDQEPFPDTFGYSAPTGFISSFGLKTKVLKRLEHPYSDCDDAFRPEVYIYDEHYSPEGCHRNCFQRRVLQNCTCGDPRYPLPHDDTDRYCGAKVESERKCLDKMIAESGGHHKLSDECICKQPCHENVFETSYSAAAWPAKNVKIGSECPADESTFNDSVKCLEYYRENTAYIEIYYEQLNFETLNETAGYSVEDEESEANLLKPK